VFKKDKSLFCFFQEMPKQKLLLISSTHLAILVSIFSIGGFQFSFPKTNLKPGQKLRGSPISVFEEN
jgi:hypothetical protein